MNALRNIHRIGDRVLRPGEPDAPARLRRRVRTGRIGPLAVLLLAVAMACPAGAQDDRTSPALEMAYQRERDTGLQYERFAARAVAEGLFTAATAFRVAVVAESVHAALQAAMIERLGGTPHWAPATIDVEGTLDNLERAIENEVHEASSVYRQLVDAIQPECQFDAMAVLNYARGAEATHVETFTRVLLNLRSAPAPGMQLAALAPPAMDWSEPLQALVVCLGDGCIFPAVSNGRCTRCGSGRGMLRTYAMPAAGDEPWLAFPHWSN